MDRQLHDNVVKVVNEVMGVDIGSMERSSKFASIPSWDSFNNLMLISRFEEEYKIRFTAVEIEQAQTVGDLFSLMQKKVFP